MAVLSKKSGANEVVGMRYLQNEARRCLGRIMLAAFWLAAAGAGILLPSAATAENVSLHDESDVRVYDEKNLHEVDGKLADVDNIPVTGEVRAYYRSGRILEKSNYTDGVKDGYSRLFFENGMLLGEATYVKGEEEGVAKIYYASGDLLAAITFVKGKAEEGYCNTRAGKSIALGDADLATFEKSGKVPCNAR